MIHLLRTHSTLLFPVNPGGHEHCLKWLIVWQLAFIPHDLGLAHGFMHWLFEQISSKPHSSEVVHEGLQ